MTCPKNSQTKPDARLFVGQNFRAGLTMDRISLQFLFSRTGFLGISRMPLEESTPGGSLLINVNIHYFYFTEIAFLRGQCIFQALRLSVYQVRISHVQKWLPCGQGPLKEPLIHIWSPPPQSSTNHSCK